MTLKKALNNKVPVDESEDWRLPIIIEEFKMNMVTFQEGMSMQHVYETHFKQYVQKTRFFGYILVYNVEFSFDSC